MQYALLIYTRKDSMDGYSESERQAMTAEYMEIRGLPGMVSGAGLQGTETATSVRRQDGQTLITDGPFADTKEVFAGFYLMEADDIDAALEVAQRIPAVRLGGVVEIRPLMEY